MKTVAEGSTVQIEFTGKLEDGTVFDKTDEGKPLEFVVGEKKVLPSLENAVQGMKKGESKTLKLEPKDAFGDRVEGLVKQIPRNALPKELEPKPGMMLVLAAPDGRKVPVTITKVEDKNITIDLNHPLAGKNVTFEIKVVDVS